MEKPTFPAIAETEEAPQMYGELIDPKELDLLKQWDDDARMEEAIAENEASEKIPLPDWVKRLY